MFRRPEAAVHRWGRRLVAERDRWVLWTPVLLGCGIGLYFSLPVEPPFWVGLAIVALSGAAAVAAGRAAAGDRGPWTTALLVASGVVLLGAGFAGAQWRASTVAAPVLSEPLGAASVVGRVVAVETRPKAVRVTLDRLRISRVAAARTPERARLRLTGSQPAIDPGDWIRVRASLSPPPAPAAPGAFDFQRRAYFERLGAVGFGYGAATVVATASEGGGFSAAIAIARLRRAVVDRVLAHTDQRSGPVMAALMTGERGAIAPAVMDAIRDAGLAHLLAISGLHIGLVAGILFVGVRAALALVPRLALRHPIKKWAAAAAIVGALAYALMAGATVPTQRAFLMIGLVLVAVLVDRRGLSMRTVAWAAVVVLLVQPESLLGPSFQMSFAAVVALIAAFEVLSARRGSAADGAPGPGRRIALYVGSVGLTTLIAGAATLPFVIYHFNRFADYGLAANLVAVPITALWVMPWAVAAFLLMPFDLEAVALTPMAWGVEAVIRIAETVASWPGAVAMLPAMPTWGLVAAAVGGLWLCLWRRRWRLLGLAGIAGGMATLVLVEPPHVLIDGRGALMAVRVDSGLLAVSSVRTARFTGETWLRRAGQEESAPWPETGRWPDGPLACDAQGCLYRHGGRVVALVGQEGALIEDCWLADVVVSRVPVRRPCPAATVIDRFDLWREGGHALWLDGETVRVETVNARRGHRPWVARPKPRHTPAGPES